MGIKNTLKSLNKANLFFKKTNEQIQRIERQTHQKQKRFSKTAHLNWNRKLGWKITRVLRNQSFLLPTQITQTPFSNTIKNKRTWRTIKIKRIKTINQTKINQNWKQTK